MHHKGPINKRHGANLPHWTADEAIFSVTFRLADSLPQSIIHEYKRKRAFLLAAYCETHGRNDHATEVTPFQFTQGDLQSLESLFAEEVERHLDAGTGSCWMSRPEIADTVQNALLFFDQQRYDLHAWVVMPNHVHVVVEPHASFELPGILHSWKSFTAKEANRLLNRTGEFWQPEPYDHLIRNNQDYDHCINYVLENPSKAGLYNWKWVGARPRPRQCRPGRES